VVTSPVNGAVDPPELPGCRDEQAEGIVRVAPGAGHNGMKPLRIRRERRDKIYEAFRALPPKRIFVEQRFRGYPVRAIGLVLRR
jgi:hypothetical protein